MTAGTLAFSAALSPFQRATIQELSERGDFVKFVTTASGFSDPAYGNGPHVHVLWFDTDGALNMWQLSRKAVMKTVRSESIT